MGIERAIFIVKPDGMTKKVSGYPLTEIVQGILKSTGLNILEKKELQLDEPSVRKLYPFLAIPDLVYGDGWKQELIDYISSSHVLALLLSGEDAERKANIVKAQLREAFSDKDSPMNAVLKNVAHVAERKDFITTYDVISFVK